MTPFGFVIPFAILANFERKREEREEGRRGRERGSRRKERKRRGKEKVGK